MNFVSGFALSFTVEVLRVLIYVGRVTNETTDVLEPPDCDFKSSFDVESSVNSSQDNTPPASPESSGSLRHRTSLPMNLTTGTLFLFLIAIINSAVVTILSIVEQASSDWEGVHGNHSTLHIFTCTHLQYLHLAWFAFFFLQEMLTIASAVENLFIIPLPSPYSFNFLKHHLFPVSLCIDGLQQELSNRT